MNVAIIGLGSMGKRRIRLLQENFKDVVIVGVDTNEERAKSIQKEFGIQYKNSIRQLTGEQIDCAFVCTAPLSHAKIIRECLENGWNIFSEINLVADGYEENIKLAEEKEKVLFLSSTPIYRGEMQAIHKTMKENNKPVRYIYHVGQYLPDWHPWEHYQNFFVGNSRTNGCREIFGIELPWMIETFGAVIKVQSCASKITSLDIDYNDNYFVKIEHENGNKGLFIVDVVSRQPVRKLEIFNEDIYIEWNGTPEKLKYRDANNRKLENMYGGSYLNIDGYSKFVNENAYLNEMREFFAILSGRKKAVYGFAEDLKTLKLIDEIEGII